MKVTIKNEQTNGKELVFEANDWTGKTKIVFDGVELKKQKNNLFFMENDGKTEKVIVYGNRFFGISLKMPGKEIEITRNLFWYEILMSMLVWMSCVVMTIIASAHSQNALYGALYGAFCGAIGGALFGIDVVLLRKYPKLVHKIVLTTELLLISVLIDYIFIFL